VRINVFDTSSDDQYYRLDRFSQPACFEKHRQGTIKVKKRPADKRRPDSAEARMKTFCEGN
jgi:hypothetical protein